MRGQAIVEFAGSLMIASLTGLFAFGGLAFGAYYAALDTHPPIQVLGLILLLVGVENLPIFLMWCRQAASEMASQPDLLMPGSGPTSAPR